MDTTIHYQHYIHHNTKTQQSTVSHIRITTHGHSNPLSALHTSQHMDTAIHCEHYMPHNTWTRQSTGEHYTHHNTWTRQSTVMSIIRITTQLLLTLKNY